MIRQNKYRRRKIALKHKAPYLFGGTRFHRFVGRYRGDRGRENYRPRRPIVVNTFRCLSDVMKGDISPETVTRISRDKEYVFPLMDKT